jgi:hypothetical protein
MSTRSTTSNSHRAGTAIAATAITALTLGVATLIAPSAQAVHTTEAGALQLTPSIPIPPPRPTRR